MSRCLSRQSESKQRTGTSRRVETGEIVGDVGRLRFGAQRVQLGCEGLVVAKVALQRHGGRGAHNGGDVRGREVAEAVDEQSVPVIGSGSFDHPSSEQAVSLVLLV